MMCPAPHSSRAPARLTVRDGPPRAQRRAGLVEARRWRSTRAGQRAVDQRCQLVRRAVRGGRPGREDVVPRPQLHRVDVRDVQEGQRYVFEKKMGGRGFLTFVGRMICTCIPVARERMIGWYHTGPKLRAADLEINELFKRFIARPVMVIVDVRPHTVGIPTDAYFAVEEIKDVRVCVPASRARACAPSIPAD